eukprot:CAMPEP_0114575392 /NCGR_PEP_ID=MMETSP0125-20121206/273_1 /TAXON_ID=485358 ORGANISM="Aristerostoma sp., Strain ATCC 50986" /NCGR_SAMPLE_ID=MMETSP0125 /ASSEMBLY_ACC=CAM_ASM_000245 /LENGTH=47 /DNA_ID= /DNA_START= /DNA_END= /DNA_ORIENTATION=
MAISLANITGQEILDLSIWAPLAVRFDGGGGIGNDIVQEILPTRLCE